jgi:hypothetical protein
MISTTPLADGRVLGFDVIRSLISPSDMDSSSFSKAIALASIEEVVSEAPMH